MPISVHRGAAVKQLLRYRDIHTHKPFTEERAKRILDVAEQFTRKAEPCEGGFVHVVYDGWSQNWPYTELFRIYDHTSSRKAQKVAQPAGMDYTSPRTVTNKKGNIMPPRGRKAAAAPVVEEPEEVEEGEFDRFLTKDLSENMLEYADWFHENVTDIDELGRTDPGRLLALGSTLYTRYQKSDSHQAKRATRKAERSAENGDAEEPEEAAPRKPARGKAAAKPAATAKPAAPARPARSRTKAAAGAELY